MHPSFARLFGRPSSVVGEAPGRVNLIGEHTDYNGGFVLPAAIPQRTRVEAAARDDRTVRVWSAQFPAGEPRAFSRGGEARGRGWLDYVQGVFSGLPTDAVRGCDLRIESGVPAGSGLSSSAALEIALGRALRALFDLPLTDLELARMGHRAETQFVGAPIGIMDQMACSFADTGAALYLDTRSLEYRRVPLPPGSALIVIDSGVAHDHAAGDYRVRRDECAEAARLLGVPELRDATDTQILGRLPGVLQRRARHVITENARVLDTVDALAAGDCRRVGTLFAESHASMRDDFEVSIPAIDRLVEIASKTPGVFGARLTGGGFGGAIVAFAQAASARAAADAIVSQYNRTGARGSRIVPGRL